MKWISCDLTRLYRNGGLYAGSTAIEQRAAAAWVSNVDPPYSYTRAMPSAVVSAEPKTTASIDHTYRAWDAEYRNGPSSDLFEIENAVVYDRTIYLPFEGEWATLYETDRPFERHFKVEPLTEERLQNVMRARPSETAYLYLGTVGSENYAHWLVDDLTRARAVSSMLARGPVAIVLDRYFEAIDRVRQESLVALLDADPNLSVIFIDKKVPFFFEKLFYVSPNSVHPFMKCPSAIEAIRSKLSRQQASASRRLFVGRKALWRNLLNEDEIVDALARLGFDAVTIDGMSFEEQITLFSNAEVIVGVSGASMGNSIFTPSGCSLIYLAGEGFIDPFYWDLAAINGHRYAVAFGQPWRPDQPTFSSFRFDARTIAQIVELVRAGTA